MNVARGAPFSLDLRRLNFRSLSVFDLVSFVGIARLFDGVDVQSSRVASAPGSSLISLAARVSQSLTRSSLPT